MKHAKDILRASKHTKSEFINFVLQRCEGKGHQVCWGREKRRNFTPLWTDQKKTHSGNFLLTRSGWKWVCVRVIPWALFSSSQFNQIVGRVRSILELIRPSQRHKAGCTVDISNTSSYSSLQATRGPHNNILCIKYIILSGCMSWPATFFSSFCDSSSSAWDQTRFRC